jgi:Uma2 family endonuclease
MSRQAVLRKHATYDDLLKVPDHLVAEIIDGDLFATPRPAIPHAVTGSRLAGDLIGPFDRGRGGPGGWWILFEPELHLGADIVVPDIAGWRRTRLAAMPTAAFLTIAPDWVCEVVSSSTETIDRGKKLGIYARENVGQVWLVNPSSETLEVYRLETNRWMLLGTHIGDATVRVEPFEAIELDLYRLWGRDAPGA